MSVVTKTTEGFYTDNHNRYVFLDGLACQDLDACYACLQQQLSLPAYFGKNLDALDEMLSDLDWIQEEKIKVVIMNPDALLSKDKKKKNDFLAVLNGGESKKLEIVYLGNAPTSK